MIEEDLDDKIPTPLNFAMLVEKHVELNDVGYLEAVTAIVEERKWEPADVAKKLPAQLLGKIEAECMERRLLKKSGPKLNFG